MTHGRSHKPTDKAGLYSIREPSCMQGKAVLLHSGRTLYRTQQGVQILAQQQCTPTSDFEAELRVIGSRHQTWSSRATIMLYFVGLRSSMERYKATAIDRQCLSVRKRGGRKRQKCSRYDMRLCTLRWTQLEGPARQQSWRHHTRCLVLRMCEHTSNQSRRHVKVA